eukprot:Protomagalhaensia_sp_Gyna_25__1757@NODE_1924_length_1415_cov_42_189680_g1584_i0_p1_GENE_NODE_1924_length_1415_cov_42_189680_g1584_i0NODE_1924_length_1415_cov_42_189680_g1584_i0_p1_ORF_typecomplete_len379_score66_29_NODE_1924_length_1415_cov_42_189680_g1584_i0471183
MRLLTEQANAWAAATAVSVSVAALTPASSAPPEFPRGSEPGGEDDEEGALPDESDAEEAEEEALETVVADPETEVVTGGNSVVTETTTPFVGPRRSRRASGGEWSVAPTWRRGGDSGLLMALAPHIRLPNTEDAYYLTALRNAHNTLNEYAAFIGVEGGDFLKHLFSYYILGTRLAAELVTRLNNSDEQNGQAARRKHPATSTATTEDPAPKKRRLRPRPRPSTDAPDPVPSTLVVPMLGGDPEQGLTEQHEDDTMPPPPPHQEAPSIIAGGEELLWAVLPPPNPVIKAPTTVAAPLRAVGGQVESADPDDDEREDHLSDITEDHESQSTAKSALSDLSSASEDESSQVPRKQFFHEPTATLSDGNYAHLLRASRFQS